MGLSLDPKNRGYLLKLWTIISIIIPFSSSFQEFLTVLLDPDIIHKICEFPCCLMVCEAVVEVITLLRRRKDIGKLLSDLDELYKEMSLGEKNNFENFIFKYQKFAKIYGIIGMTAVYAFNLLPAFRMIYSKYIAGVFAYYSPFYFWYPFNEEDHFTITYFYELLSGHTNVLLSVISLQLFILITTQISGHFINLGEKLQNDIIAFNEKKLTKENFNKSIRKIIENHIKLLDCSDRVADIFGLICFFIISLGSIMICFTGFCVTVSFNLILRK